MKIIESYEVKDKFMKTPIGDVEILYVHKTIKYDIFEITLDNGLKLQGSEQHCLISSEGDEIRLKDIFLYINMYKEGKLSINFNWELQTWID